MKISQMKNLAKILSNRNLIKPQSMTFGLRSFSINRSQKLKLNPLLHEFYAEVSNNRIDSALELYGKLLVECESSLGKDVYSSLINALDPRTGSTHLAVAEDIFKHVVNKFGRADDDLCLGMIRCYCRAGQLDEAYDILKGCLQTTTVPKARLFQPLIDYACNIKKNPQDALNFVDDMKALNIEITPEILTAILIASRQSNSCSDIKVASRIDDLISTYATQSIGVSLNYARKLVSAYMNLSPKAVIEQGTLVAHQDQIKGEILSIDGDYDKTFDHKSVAYIEAIVNSHVDSSTNIKFDTIAAKRVRYQSMISSNPIDTLTDNAFFEFNVERFVALNNKESSSPAPTHEDYDDQIKADTADGGAPISATATTATTAAATATATTPSSSSTNMRIRKLPTVDARIVHIDPTTCVCPNCDNPIQLMHLTQSEIKSTRNAISDYLMSTMNNEQYANPEWFRQWILKKGPFRYIIDGANVAFSGGRVNVQFTFNQIKVLLEKLSEPRYLPGKPLVILPHNFLKSFLDPRYKGAPRSQLSSTIIPNKDGEMSRKDINTFVWQMHRKGMLFSIPKGFSDDLFWVYATLENTLHSHIYSITTTIGSSSSSSSSPLTTDMKADTLSSSNSKQSIPSTQNSDTSGSDTSNSKLLDDRIYIISNDCTNDHRGLFPSAQAFVRWRASQMINFTLPPKRKFDSSTKLVPDDIKLTFPGKYSWEIQRARPIESDPLTRAATTINDTSDVDDKSNSHASNTSNCNGRWHIPIYDKQSWLCIKVNSKTSKI